MVEPARVNPKAPGIADPLKDLHDTIDEAKQIIAEASIDIGTVTTLTPAKKATSALAGTGLKRKLNLGIPRGSKISSVTATALDAATPTVNTSTDANGDTIIALGLPRGKQGEKGDKGDPGDAGGLATADKAGIVRPGPDFSVWSDGVLYLKDNARSYSKTGLYASPFNVGTLLVYRGMGIYYEPIITLSPNPEYRNTPSVEGPVEIQVLPDTFEFSPANTYAVRFLTMVLVSSRGLTDGVSWVGVKATPVEGTGNISLEFFDSLEEATPYTLYVSSSGATTARVCSPSFTFRVVGAVRK